MGIWSRIRVILASHVNAVLEQGKDPEKAVENLMRSMRSDVGKLRAETAAMSAEERRARSAWEECKEERRKLLRYAERAEEAGNDGDARRFGEKAAALAEPEQRLLAALEIASANLASMKQIEDKLSSELDRLETQLVQLKGRLLAAESQQRMNAGTLAFHKLEEEVNRVYYEAMAIAELRNDPKDETV